MAWGVNPTIRCLVFLTVAAGANSYAVADTDYQNNASETQVVSTSNFEDVSKDLTEVNPTSILDSKVKAFFENGRNDYLNKEYAYVTKKYSIEASNGAVDGDEIPLEAAKRELLEETGISANEYVSFGYVPGQSYLLFGTLVLNVLIFFVADRALRWYFQQKK